MRYLPSPAFKAMLVENVDINLKKAKIELLKVEAEISACKYEDASVYCNYLYNTISKLKFDLDGLPND